jgi:hypothetical protein
MREIFSKFSDQPRWLQLVEGVIVYLILFGVARAIGVPNLLTNSAVFFVFAALLLGQNGMNATMDERLRVIRVLPKWRRVMGGLFAFCGVWELAALVFPTSMLEFATFLGVAVWLMMHGVPGSDWRTKIARSFVDQPRWRKVVAGLSVYCAMFVLLGLLGAILFLAAVGGVALGIWLLPRG